MSPSVSHNHSVLFVVVGVFPLDLQHLAGGIGLDFQFVAVGKFDLGLIGRVFALPFYFDGLDFAAFGLGSDGRLDGGGTWLQGTTVS